MRYTQNNLDIHQVFNFYSFHWEFDDTANYMQAGIKTQDASTTIQVLETSSVMEKYDIQFL